MRMINTLMRFCQTLFGPGDGPAWRMVPVMSANQAAVADLALLKLLEACGRQRTDPTPMIEALAEESRGIARARFRYLAKLLRRSTPMIEAIEQIPGILPEDAVLALRLGNQSGTLPETYAMLLESQRQANSRSRFDWTGVFTYWWIVGLVLLAAIVWMNAFIAPTMRKVYDESGSIAEPFGLSIRSLFPIAFLLLLLVSLLVVVGVFDWLRTWLRNSILRSAGLQSLAMRWSSGRVAGLLRMLSVNTAAGRPIAGALSTLAKYHSNPWIRQRLLLSRNEIEQGADPWQGLREAGLITIDQEAGLSRVQGNASQAWVLRQLANQLENRVCESQHRLGLWVHPILAVAFGCVVGWLTYGMFRSLYGLVQSLS